MSQGQSWVSCNLFNNFILHIFMDCSWVQVTSFLTQDAMARTEDQATKSLLLLPDLRAHIGLSIDWSNPTSEFKFFEFGDPVQELFLVGKYQVDKGVEERCTSSFD